MGYVPDWYTIIYAAKYLGVAPWDLLDQPSVWLEWALDAQSAETLASKQRNKK